MNFNKLKRGNKREQNTEESLFEVLDEGFICDIGFQSNGQTMIIPTAYGRKDDYIYIHGSNKNHMMNEICNGQLCCICVNHLDGIVLAKSLFNTSANYRSAIIFGKSEIINDEKERIDGLKIITENIIKGRWEEVPIGDENEIRATLVVKIKIESATVKIRNGGPTGDEENEKINIWSGHIPLKLKAENPINDIKFRQNNQLSKSVLGFLKKYHF